MNPIRRLAVLGARILGVGALLVACAPGDARAQGGDTLKAPPKAVVGSDTTKRIPSRMRSTTLAAPVKPPLTPKRAFLYSLFVPGLGQSKLDRGSAGAFFAAIELGSLAMIQKSSSDLRQARKYSGDSLPNNYTVQADGTLSKNGTFSTRFPIELVNTRRLHKEDWFAALLFNHLISGADAFVAAQLWDGPATVAAIPSPDGVMLVATLHW